MRALKHWTPRYLVNRFNLFLYQQANQEVPWLTDQMNEVLKCWLHPTDNGLEWGSGRSTLWFAKRVHRLISIEHDQAWYTKIKNQFANQSIANVDYYLCQDEKEYVSTGMNLPENSFDFCLVDGIVRDRCALSAISRLKPGGILILDNSNWYLPCESHAPSSRTFIQGPSSLLWSDFLGQVKHWRCIWTTNGVSDTTLWIKPF